MRVCPKDEMLKLRKIFEPFEKDCELSKNAPPEAVTAFKKYMELYEEEKERNSRIDLL